MGVRGGDASSSSCGNARDVSADVPDRDTLRSWACASLATSVEMEGTRLKLRRCGLEEGLVRPTSQRSDAGTPYRRVANVTAHDKKSFGTNQSVIESDEESGKYTLSTAGHAAATRARSQRATLASTKDPVVHVVPLEQVGALVTNR